MAPISYRGPAKLPALGFALGAVLAACGSKTPEASRAAGNSVAGASGTQDSTDSGAGGGSAGSDNAAGGTGGTGAGGFNVNDASSGSTNPDSSCAATTIGGEQVTTTKTVTTTKPVAIYIMLDESRSMSDQAATGGQTKWQVVTDGLTSFVNDMASAGIDIALNLFPPPGSCPVPTDCNGASYATPLVAMGTLPANAAAITGAIPAMPGGSCGTPTEPALRGAEQFCSTYHPQHPDEQCVVLLVTDGIPNGCSADTTLLSGLASTALQQDGTLTFAVGMNVPGGGAGVIDFNLLDAIAKAGGTNCNPPAAGNEACNIGGGSDLSAALALIRQTVTVMQTITQTTTVPCQWKLPAPPDGGKLDPAKVNVSLTTGGMSEDIGGVASSADCANVQNGWYYDDPNAPTTIIVCPDTCTTIQGATDARVDIALGCVTRSAIPK